MKILFFTIFASLLPKNLIFAATNADARSTLMSKTVEIFFQKFSFKTTVNSLLEYGAQRDLPMCTVNRKYKIFPKFIQKEFYRKRVVIEHIES